MPYAIVRYKMFEGPISIISLYDDYQKCKDARKRLCQDMPCNDYVYELRGIRNNDAKIGDVIGTV